MAYALIVEDAGLLADRAEVREKLDGVLKAAGSKSRNRAPSLDLARARRMAQDVADYDQTISKGGT